MRTNRGWIILFLALAVFVTDSVAARAADTSFDTKILVVDDYLAGKIPYTGPPVKYTGPPITIRYSTFMGKAMGPFMNVYEPAAKMLEKESNGKLILKPYFSNVLHGPQDGFKACKDNITDFTHGYTLWQPSSFHMIHGLSLPFAFPNSPVATMVGEELAAKYFRKEYEKMGVYLAGIQMTAPYHLLSLKPIKKVEEVKGMKIRSGGGIMGDVVKSLGAVPVMVPASEFYTAFQRGVFDAILSHDAGFIVFRTYEIGKFKTILYLTTANTEYALNKKFFDGLPPDLKRIFYNWLRKYNQAYAQAYYEKEGALALDKIKQAGIETITLPPAELERWKATVHPVWDKFVADNEGRGLPAKELVKDMKALNEKYSAMTWDDLMKKTIENPPQGLIDF